MLCSFQQEHIVSPAIPALIALRSANTLKFLSKFSVSPLLSWQCGIAFHSCLSQDYLGLSLGRTVTVSDRFNSIIKKWLLPIAFEIIEMTWNDLDLFCQLYGFKSPYLLKLLLNHIGHHMTALRV